LGRRQAQLAAHAQVAHERLAGVGAVRIGQAPPQELPAPCHGRERGSLERRAQPVRSPGLAADDPGVEQLETGHGAADGARLETAPDDLDLGQFGQCAQPRGISGSPRSARTPRTAFWAAASSASFFEAPSPLAVTMPGTVTVAVKVFWCSRPDSLIA